VESERFREKIREKLGSEFELVSHLNSPEEECQEHPYWSEERILR